LDPMLAFVSAKHERWTKSFFVDVLMTGPSLSVYSNCLTTLGEEPSPSSGSFIFVTLGDRLVVGFLGNIVPAFKINI